ncbi:hypothetical protein AC578_7639 [Pseudocercospora eumusae]|uniref:Uncharacterized protein n=1 Tax=Pseudocercospora eumusae TaxID=321146 RepID=A0A139H645_9PEZI|nr:hypothetical protein AC578_7639 [Pseudocercospora eumusae]
MMASPLLYPGQTLHARLSAPELGAQNFTVGFRLMVYSSNDKLVAVDSDSTIALRAESHLAELSWTIPIELSNKPIQQVGLLITPLAIPAKNISATVYLHSLSWVGAPHMTLQRPAVSEQAGVENSADLMSMWERSFVSSVDKFHTSLGPSFYLSQDRGQGMIIHGTREWKDYKIRVNKFAVHLGQPAGVAVRVRGLRRWYALMFLPGKVAIVKTRDDERKNLAMAEFDWKLDAKYEVQVCVEADKITGQIGELVISAEDDEYEGGGIGLIVTEGAVSADRIQIQPI